MVHDLMYMSKLFVLLTACPPPAVSSSNPDDPNGPPICADWEIGSFGRVMTNAYN